MIGTAQLANSTLFSIFHKHPKPKHCRLRLTRIRPDLRSVLHFPPSFHIRFLNATIPEIPREVSRVVPSKLPERINSNRSTGPTTHGGSLGASRWGLGVVEALRNLSADRHRSL